MKKIVSSLIFLCFLTSSYAQKYNTAAGLRISQGLGLTVQQRIADKLTIEGIAFTNFLTASHVAVLGEYHGKLVAKRLNWYVGAGIHSGREKGEDNPKGMIAVGGIELAIKRLVLSVDVMPKVNFVGGSKTFDFGAPAVSARYILIERPKTTIGERIQKGKKNKNKKGKTSLKDKIFKN